MLIDAHTHIHEKGIGGPFSLPCTADALVAAMDKSGVDVSVVVPLPGIAPNIYVHDQCNRFPDRLVPLCCPDFSSPKDTVARLCSFVDKHKVHGLKIHPRVQGVTVADPVVQETLHCAAERELPVVFDAFPFGPTFGDAEQHPAAYCRIAQELPQLQVVLAHAGGYRALEAFLAAKACANILVDVSFTPTYFCGTSIESDLRFICERLPTGQVLYGSDFPEVGLSESLSLARRMTNDVAAERKDAIFGKTARSVFGIQEYCVER